MLGTRHDLETDTIIAENPLTGEEVGRLSYRKLISWREPVLPWRHWLRICERKVEALNRAETSR